MHLLSNRHIFNHNNIAFCHSNIFSLTLFIAQTVWIIELAHIEMPHNPTNCLILYDYSSRKDKNLKIKFYDRNQADDKLRGG